MANINAKMEALGNVRSVIRETFEYGNRRAAEIGRENIFDYSLGNPSTPSPDCFLQELAELARTADPVALHGYTSAPGALSTRQAIADDLNRRFCAGAQAGDLYMTCGAAASLTVTLHALTNPGDHWIVVAPFFPEYRVFVEKTGAVLDVVPAQIPGFQIDFAALESLLTPQTKGIIVNSPNNPSGAVLSRKTVAQLCKLLAEKSEAFGAPIYLVSDEPYRELVYDKETEVAWLPAEYRNTIVCYSFSKSLSLPGERIGYIYVPAALEEQQTVYAAICGAGRALGFVCAPSMMQRAIITSLGQTSDLEAYRTNRDLLYNALTKMGYDCVYPDGAFYLFVKSPEEDANAFCMKAREFELLLVPSDSFGCPGYVRLSYCVSTDMIRRSLPAFEKLAVCYR